jgi:hypothetical protein
MKVSMDNLREQVGKVSDLLRETEELIGGVKCISCNRVFSTLEDIAFIKEYNICVMCDSIKHDADEDLYREVNGGGNPDETTEDKLRTDAYIEGGNLNE